MSQTTYSVRGMSCAHCVTAVTQELEALNGVTAVVVDLPTGAVSVTSDHPLDRTDVASAITEAGYELI